MTEVLDALYQLRILRGRCEAGAELDMDDVYRMSALERQVRANQVGAILKVKKFSDSVVIDELGPSGMRCQGCPWVDVGAVVEIVIEIERNSYRFKMLVSATREDAAGDLEADLAFVGIPVLLRRGPKSESAAPSLQRFAA